MMLGAVAAGGGHAAVKTDPLEALGDGLGVGPIIVDDQHFAGGSRCAVAAAAGTRSGRRR